MKAFLDMLVPIVSLVVFPFFGVLSCLRNLQVRILPYLGGAVFLWLFYGWALVGGGMMSRGEGDIVTPAERAAWMATPYFQSVAPVWGIGLGIGVVLLGLTILFEKISPSKWFRVSWTAIKIGGFVVGVAAFLKLYVLDAS